MTLARPIQGTLPSLGTKCGRRERGAEATDGRSDPPLSFALVTVEGILAFVDTTSFAGRRGNVRPRSVQHVASWSLHGAQLCRRQRMPGGRRGTERRPRTHQSVRTRRGIRSRTRGLVLPSVLRLVRLASAPLSGPSGSLMCAVMDASRSGKPLSGRNRHRGVHERTNVRLATPHRESACGVRTGRRSRPPSLRGSRDAGFCPYVVGSCRSRQADVRPQISMCTPSKKGTRHT